MSTSIRQITASQTWPLRHEVMWPDMPLDYVKLPNDEEGIHYGLFVGEQLTSVVSLFADDQEAQFRKLATAVGAQGNGYGTMLLSHLMKETQALSIDRVWCNARIDKTSFYHKFGLKETARTFIKNRQSYVVMEKLISH
ncbi:GNAT family N-acetyltransferase [Roseivirga sp. E12]|uniref:GNAT family N-acetyltransferase n=1 Tax=Roseivirga sp. E12 TaxID=2819237 RepID=UPI001ABD1542|nr:GNAT family N-acetyltransferase [Roseivirga sp. E12]MBO3697698.1 GNAT family N-acetyltransferase [Roseivirga sp. E12]